MCSGICLELRDQLLAALAEGKLRQAAGIAATGVSVMIGAKNAGTVGKQDRGTNGDVPEEV